MRQFNSVDALARLERKSRDDDAEGRQAKQFVEWVKTWGEPQQNLRGLIAGGDRHQASNTKAGEEQGLNPRNPTRAYARRIDKVLKSKEMADLLDGEEVEIVLTLEPEGANKVRAKVVSNATGAECLKMLAEVNPRLLRDLYKRLKETA